MAVRFVAPRVPFVDIQTGQITREWFLFLQGFFPSQSSSATDDMTLALGQTNAAPEIDAALYEVRQTAGLDMDSLRDQVAELRKAVEDLQKGLVVL